ALLGARLAPIEPARARGQRTKAPAAGGGEAGRQRGGPAAKGGALVGHGVSARAARGPGPGCHAPGLVFEKIWHWGPPARKSSLHREIGQLCCPLHWRPGRGGFGAGGRGRRSRDLGVRSAAWTAA